MTLSTMTCMSVIALEEVAFMSMFAYNYYNPQINNVLNRGVDTLSKINPLNYRIGLVQDAYGGLHWYGEYVGGTSSIAIPIANVNALSPILNMTNEAIAMMFSNGNGGTGNNFGENGTQTSSGTGSPNTNTEINPDGDNYTEGSGSGLDNNLSSRIDNLVNEIEIRNGTPPNGYKGGRIYNNTPIGDTQRLPEGITYKEYDVNPYIRGVNRGSERIIIGSDKSVWYTNNHYETFTRIK